MRVCKSWSKISKRVIYRKIVFTSVKQREAFFACLQLQVRNQETLVSSARKPPTRSNSSKSPSGYSPPPLILPRKLLKANVIPDSIKCIQSLDFGLRPRNGTVGEPELPMTKFSFSPAVLSSPSPLSLSSPMTMLSNMTSNSSLASPTRQGSASHKHNRPPSSSSSIVTRARAFGQTSRNPTQTPAKNDSTMEYEDQKTYGQWSDRFVSPLLINIAQLIPNLRELCLCSCHINAKDFGLALQGLGKLTRLDISYTTLKSDGLEMVARYCRTNLVWLNISGIFKLGRNKRYAIQAIASHCDALKEVVAYECPELYEEILDECQDITKGRIQFYVDPLLNRQKFT